MECLRNRHVGVFAALMPALVFVACKSETHTQQSNQQGAVSFQRYQTQTQMPMQMPMPTAEQPSTPTTMPRPQEDPNLYSNKIEKEFQSWKDQGFFSKTAGVDGRTTSYGMPSYNYTCGSSAPDCANKFVRVIMQSESEGMACTGVLIASDLVLTNRHCVPFMDQPNTSFGKYTIGVEFPNGVVANIENLVGMSPPWLYGEGHLNVDFAILKIDKNLFYQFVAPYKQLNENPYTPVSISHEGFKDGQTYYVYSTTPYGDKANDTVIEKRPCKAIYNTIFGSQFQSAQSPVVSLADCPIGPGNSGSPIFNEAGQLVGIISGQFSPAGLLGLSAIAKADGMLTADTFNNVGWGTNLACLPSLAGESYKVDPKCNDELAKSQLRGVRPLDPALEEQAKQLLTHDMQDNQFQYQVARADQGVKVSDFLTSLIWIRIPRCVNASALENNDKLSLKTDLVGIQIDANGVVLNTLSSKNEAQLALDFNRDDLKAKGSTEMTASIGQFLYYTGKLELCH